MLVDTILAGLDIFSERFLFFAPALLEEFFEGECKVLEVFGIISKPICLGVDLLPSKIELRFKTGLTEAPRVLLELKDSC